MQWFPYTYLFVFIIAPPTLSDLEPPYDKTHQERLSSQQVAFPCPAKGICWTDSIVQPSIFHLSFYYNKQKV